MACQSHLFWHMHICWNHISPVSTDRGVQDSHIHYPWFYHTFQDCVCKCSKEIHLLPVISPCHDFFPTLSLIQDGTNAIKVLFFQKFAAGNKYAMLMIIWSSCTVMSTFQDYWPSSKQLRSSIVSSHLAYSPQYCWVVLAFLSCVKSSTRMGCNEETSTKTSPEISQGVESKVLQEKRRWVNGEFIVRPDKGGVELGKVIPLM